MKSQASNGVVKKRPQVCETVTTASACIIGLCMTSQSTGNIDAIFCTNVLQTQMRQYLAKHRFDDKSLEKILTNSAQNR